MDKNNPDDELIIINGLMRLYLNIKPDLLTDDEYAANWAFLRWALKEGHPR